MKEPNQISQLETRNFDLFAVFLRIKNIGGYH